MTARSANGANLTAVTDKAADGSGRAERCGLGARLLADARGILLDDTDRSQLQRDAMLAFSVRVLSAGILYLSQIVLARWMGDYEYGIYVSVWTWVLVLGGLSNLGLAPAMIRLLPEYREQAQLELLRGLLRDGRLLVFAAASLVAGLGLIGLILFGSPLSKPYVWPAYLALVCVPMITLSDTHDGIGRGGGWMAEALVPPYVLRPLLILATMIVLHEIGWRIGADTAMGAAVIATWGCVALQYFLLRRRIADAVPAGRSRPDGNLWLRISLPLLAIAGSELLLQNADVLIIGYYLAPDQGAIYFAAAKTMALVMFVHYAVGSAMAKRFSTLNARGDKAELRQFVRDAVHWTFWPSLSAALLILAFGKPLLWLFGPQFTSGYPIMFVLVAGFLGRAAMGPSEFLLNMLGEQKACAAVIMSTAAFNILLQTILVPRLGILGAAAATAIALVAGALSNTIVARRRLGIDIAIWNNLRRS